AGQFRSCRWLRYSAALARRSRHRHLQLSISPADITTGDIAMKVATRFTIVAISLLLCAGGTFIAHSSREEISNSGTCSEPIDAITSDDGYQFATHPALRTLTV